MSLAGMLLLAGCAAPPRQELQGARRAVAEAYSREAFRLAPEEYQAASEALREGERLIRDGRYDRAAKALSFAESHARRAQLQARQERIRIEEEERRLHQARLEEERRQTDRAPQGSPPPSPEPSASEPPAPEPPAPAPAPFPVPEPKPAAEPQAATHYTVVDGETLWTIAARGRIYRDALLWPLIYKANRDQIKDPRQIYPGQVLNIPRDMSADEKETARETARASDIFPLRELIESRSRSDPAP